MNREDIDEVNNQMHIIKTFYRLNGEDILSMPKTEQLVRIVDIPEFLRQEIVDYYNRLYEYPKDARLFPLIPEVV